MAQGSFFPMDPAMDLCILTALQLAFGRLHIPRLLAAYLLLGASTAIYLTMDVKGALAWLPIAFLFPSAAIACGARGFKRSIEAGVCMFCISICAAGFSLLCVSPPLPGALVGMVLLILIFRQRRNVLNRWSIELCVERDGLFARFEALIDTGNRLREHGSGLPVLIVEAAAAGGLYEYVSSLPESEKRTLPYGVLGGSGEISCFKADRILLYPRNKKPADAPDCWIAVYPGRIPGAMRALAPPEFADALQEDRFIPEYIQNGARRFYYGVFKR